MEPLLSLPLPLPPAAPRRGGVPVWVPLALLALLLGAVGTYLLERSRRAGLATIDTRRFVVRALDTPLLPAWEDRLAALLARAGPLSAHDRAGLEEVARRVSELSFVAEVGTPEVVWPDGLSLPVRFHVPSANVRVGDVYLTVAEDGSVLTGASSLPHETHGVPLPVLGPLDGALDRLRPGDRLVDDRHRDALAVAISLVRELTREERAALGRVLIDASRDEAPDGRPGGVLLDLEDRRRILFGRSPRGFHPGELPASVKWRHVARGLERLAGGEDWAVLDVRWDHFDVYTREQAEAARGR